VRPNSQKLFQAKFRSRDAKICKSSRFFDQVGDGSNNYPIKIITLGAGKSVLKEKLTREKQFDQTKIVTKRLD
jgi:hypothetical protein